MKTIEVHVDRDIPVIWYVFGHYFYVHILISTNREVKIPENPGSYLWAMLRNDRDYNYYDIKYIMIKIILLNSRNSNDDNIGRSCVCLWTIFMVFYLALVDCTYDQQSQWQLLSLLSVRNRFLESVLSAYDIHILYTNIIFTLSSSLYRDHYQSDHDDHDGHRGHDYDHNLLIIITIISINIIVILIIIIINIIIIIVIVIITIINFKHDANKTSVIMSLTHSPQVLQKLKISERIRSELYKNKCDC